MKVNKHIKRGMSFLLVFTLILIPLAACDKGTGAQAPEMRAFGEYKLEPVKTKKAKVPEYKVKADFSNVMNADSYVMSEDVRQALLKNKFVIIPNGHEEFFAMYEENRYSYLANLVTVDSMLHTYHLYFNYLLKTVEEEELAEELFDMSEELIDISWLQLKKLKGTSWEDAARRNLAYFTVGACLLDDYVEVYPEVYDEVVEELENIKDASAVNSYSPVMNIGVDIIDTDGALEDYTQYKPRGHYTKSRELENYFKAMMFYGRQTFRFNHEDEVRSAILMSYALMDSDVLDKWANIYETTAFFAGVSDDVSPFDTMGIVYEIYGANPDYKALPKDKKKFKEAIDEMKKVEKAQINSMLVFDKHIHPDRKAVTAGFRLFGQRYTLDADIFQHLMYRDVGPNSNGEKRMLPKALDVPAAMGSDEALAILENEGDFRYKDYESNMKGLRKKISEIKEDTWQSNLYWGWLYNLKPLTEKTPDGYPEFMKNKLWSRKNLNTFIGSWTELKHDTVLYSKQAMAEMGGGSEPEKIDDRGYVEPQPEVYARLAALTAMTRTGLEERGLLPESAEDSLKQLEKISLKLKEISEKELAGKELSNKEYKFIKTIGGELEHLWIETLEDDEDEYPNTYDHPCMLVADVATGDGAVLHEGTGCVFRLIAIVPVAGKLQIVSGPVYSTYEFVRQGERLNDEEWIEIVRWVDAMPEMPSWMQKILLKDGRFYGKFYDEEYYDEDYDEYVDDEDWDEE